MSWTTLHVFIQPDPIQVCTSTPRKLQRLAMSNRPVDHTVPIRDGPQRVHAESDSILPREYFVSFIIIRIRNVNFYFRIELGVPYCHGARKISTKMAPCIQVSKIDYRVEHIRPRAYHNRHIQSYARDRLLSLKIKILVPASSPKKNRRFLDLLLHGFVGGQVKQNVRSTKE